MGIRSKPQRNADKKDIMFSCLTYLYTTEDVLFFSLTSVGFFFLKWMFSLLIYTNIGNILKT